ncbi:MAG: transporter substrate-binding domain-containing protein [Caldilineaceae bacterium]
MLTQLRNKRLAGGERRWRIIVLCGLLAIVLFILIFERRYIFPAPDETWQAMQQRRTWRVGTDPSFPPFEQLDANGQPVGYDIDLARQLAATWGLQVQVVALGFDSLLDALQTGQVDSVMSALPYDERLTQNVTYSAPYFEAGIRLVVRKNSPIQTAAQLTNRKIAVELGSTGDMVGRRLQRATPTLQLVQFPTPDEAVAALEQDQAIDALLIDQVTLRTAQGKGATLVAIGDVMESNPYVIAMPHKASILQAQVEQTLQSFQTNGVLKQLETKWFHPIK